MAVTNDSENHTDREEPIDPVERISHEEAQRLISFAWDGEITEREAVQLSRHLKQCEACADDADDMMDLLGRIERFFPPRRRGKGDAPPAE